MHKQQLNLPTGERLRGELESLPGVSRAVVEGPPYSVDLICDPAAAGLPLEAGANAVLIREGVAPESATLRISYLSAALPRRRVRFVDIDVHYPRVGQVEATTQLEWAGRVFRGTATGEGGAAGELRICAMATVQALEEVLNGRVSFTLIGTKAVRIFDHDLIAVLLHSDEAADRRLTGVSQVVEGVHRSAAIAVLNATNRALGNYLITGG